LWNKEIAKYFQGKDFMNAPWLFAEGESLGGRTGYVRLWRGAGPKLAPIPSHSLQVPKVEGMLLHVKVLGRVR
jgi:hypothetical protein